MGDEQPLESTPQGPSCKIHQTPDSNEVQMLLRELRNDLLTVNFNGHTIRDPSTGLDYTNILEFVVALVDVRGNPVPNSDLDGLLFTTIHVIRLLNNVERQLSFNLIQQKIGRIRALLRTGGAPSGAAALQWTALERLMNLVDIHVDIKF